MHKRTKTIVLEQTTRANMPNKMAKLSLIIILVRVMLPSSSDEVQLPRNNLSPALFQPLVKPWSD